MPIEYAKPQEAAISLRSPLAAAKISEIAPKTPKFLDLHPKSRHNQKSVSTSRWGIDDHALAEQSLRGGR
jgi:hypothetical protein